MRAMLLGLGLIATGCVTNNGPMNPNGSGSVVPQIGTWQYGQISPISNSCGQAIPQSQYGNFQIDGAGATSFHVDPQDGTAPFTCTLNGASFDCPDRAAGSDDLHPAYDAVVSFHATANGTFSTTTAGSGQQHATVSCSGSQCSQIASFPCQFAVSFSIDAL